MVAQVDRGPATPQLSYRKPGDVAIVAGTIANWYVFISGTEVRIGGDIDGKHRVTSAILDCLGEPLSIQACEPPDPFDEDMIVRTRNSRYRLGQRHA